MSESRTLEMPQGVSMSHRKHIHQMCGILSRVQAVPPDQVFPHFSGSGPQNEPQSLSVVASQKASWASNSAFPGMGSGLSQPGGF